MSVTIPDNYITISEAAVELGLTTRAVRYIINRSPETYGAVPLKIGGSYSWVMPPEALDTLKSRPTGRGRPPKSTPR